MDKRIGAQLFTVKEFCKTLEDFDETCRKISEMGYKVIQLSAIGDFEAVDIKKILDNLEKAVSPEYFSKNVLALINEKGNFGYVPQEISGIIEKWESNPDINLYSEVLNNGIKLHYPMLVLYDSTESTFDDVIKNSVSTINSEFAKRTINIGMDIELFFILIPVESAKIIKEGVIEWISKNEPLR